MIEHLYSYHTPTKRKTLNDSSLDLDLHHEGSSFMSIEQKLDTLLNHLSYYEKIKI